MIATLIIIIAIIVGIVCLVIANRNMEDTWFIIGLILTVVGVILGILCTIAIIDVNVNKDIYYQNTIYEKEMLEYRIDNMEDNIVGNEMLYNDIVEFNNELRSVKKWAYNPFTNWFYVKEIAAINYVELDMN